jgi:hypothetical protein
VPDTRAADWWRAVELGARGRYGEAWAVLEPLASGDGRWASLSASTIGSHHRQLGRHVIGRQHDERALALAVDAETLAEAHLGLAADAVGLNGLGTARAHLERARAALAPAGSSTGRVEIRARWVAAEVCLLAGEPADEPSYEALRLAEAAGMERHVAKSLLFVAVSDPPAALSALRRSWAISTGLGYETLVWPAGGLLLERAPSSPGLRARVVSAVDLISASLPADVAQGWVQRTGILMSNEIH